MDMVEGKTGQEYCALRDAAFTDVHCGPPQRLAVLLSVVLQRQRDALAQVIHLQVDVALQRVRRAILLPYA